MNGRVAEGLEGLKERLRTRALGYPGSPFLAERSGAGAEAPNDACVRESRIPEREEGAVGVASEAGGGTQWLEQDRCFRIGTRRPCRLGHTEGTQKLRAAESAGVGAGTPGSAG